MWLRLYSASACWRSVGHQVLQPAKDVKLGQYVWKVADRRKNPWCTKTASNLQPSDLLSNVISNTTTLIRVSRSNCSIRESLHTVKVGHHTPVVKRDSCRLKTTMAPEHCLGMCHPSYVAMIKKITRWLHFMIIAWQIIFKSLHYCTVNTKFRNSEQIMVRQWTISRQIGQCLTIIERTYTLFIWIL